MAVVYECAYYKSFAEISLSVSVLLCEWAHLLKCGETLESSKGSARCLLDANVQNMDKTSIAPLAKHLDYGNLTYREGTAINLRKVVFNFNFCIFPLLSPDVVMYLGLGILIFLFYTMYVRALIY